MRKKKSNIDIYKKRKRIEIALKIITPIIYWGCLIGCFICLYFAIKNSFGNMAELINLLDSKKYTSVELQEHYNMLVERYGEWHIGSGSTGFQLNFINIKKVFFSGVMLANLIGSGICLAGHIIAKKILPKVAQRNREKNQDLVNMEMLKKEE